MLGEHAEDRRRPVGKAEGRRIELSFRRDALTEINRQGVTILLVEQNVYQSLRIAHRAYVLETGRVVLTGTGAELLMNDDHVKKAFLGM